jgi:type II secretory pathway pseudopilin PulG
MTVLLIALLLLLTLIISGLSAAVLYLFGMYQRSQEAFTNQVRTHAMEMLAQANEIAKRGPAETRDLINVVTESVSEQSKNMMEAVRTAWNPNPLPETPAQPAPFKYTLPTPLGADESIRPDDSDPTDALEPGGSRAIADQISSEESPFGIEGLGFTDPLAGLARK